MNCILDAGALIALDRGDRAVASLLSAQQATGSFLRTHGGVVGQVWRGGRRQVPLARALKGVEVVALGAALGRQSGTLLAASGTADVIDAALVLLASDGDMVLTADPSDIAHLADAAGTDIQIITV